jgi:transcriptional regulator with XRE-family HTH domain
MSIVRITGAQLHAARALSGISRETLAERAGVSRYSILKWENSSDAAPDAMYRHLCRAIGVLEDAGVEFTAHGVERAAWVTAPSESCAPTMRTIVSREQAEVAP